MAKSKDDVKYGTAQAKLSEDEMMRVAYKHGTPLEGGKIAESEPVEIFGAAKKISSATGATKREAGGARDPEEADEATSKGDGGGN